MALPGPVKDIWTFWRDIQKKTMRAVDVALIGDPGVLRDSWQEALLEGSPCPQRLEVADLDRRDPVHADVALVVLDGPSGGDRRAPGALLGFDRKQMVGILAAEADDPLRIREAAGLLQILPDQLLTAASPQGGAADLTRHVAEHLHDYLIPLARQFPILREGAAWSEIHATSKQNAVVGVLPVPGADMPIMTANQIKMVLRIAAIYDLPLTSDRLREVLAVVGGGLGLRTAARQLVKLIPGPGWAIAGGIGYSGTLAMGKAALEYFKRTTRPDGALTVDVRSAAGAERLDA